MMKICVFGAGSLGSALGGMLARNHDVTLVGRRQNVEAIRRNGLRLVGDITGSVRIKAVEHVDNLEAPDLLIISTKAYDTRSAVRACKRLVRNTTMALTLQNGLGNLELLREWMGGRAFGGTTTIGAALISPGIVRVSGLGWTTIGSDVNPSGAEDILKAFRSSGIRTKLKRDITSEIWGKAVVNACINPTAAVLRVRNGRLLESGTIMRFMRGVCNECEQVATVSGVSLPSKRMFQRVRAVCGDTANNICSMLQDVRKAKRTEISEINGAFCDLGKRHGVPTPLNNALVAIIDHMRDFNKGERLIS